MNTSKAKEILHGIHKNVEESQAIKIMEVCGTHTHAIAKYGIHDLVGSDIRLLSGPGCPVCVTPESYIDGAITILDHENTLLVTFGDLMKVTGKKGSLAAARERGKKIDVVYSPFDAVRIAEINQHKQVVFLAVGFETTAPVIAAVVKHVEERNLDNVSFLLSLRRMPPVLHKVLQRHHGGLQGLICPGHVAAVMGEAYFQFITEIYDMPAVICGFDALDIISGIYELTRQISRRGNRKVTNLYRQCVSPQGNQRAKQILEEVFDVKDGAWRGMGFIENSSYVFNGNYDRYDAAKKYDLNIQEHQKTGDCRCGEILMGLRNPLDCEYFGKACSPSSPLGPCMVSGEGACAAVYRYQKGG